MSSSTSKSIAKIMNDVINAYLNNRFGLYREIETP